MVKLDPSSYRAHEQRHVVLHGTGRYAEAVSAFDSMLSIMRASPDVRGESLLRYRAEPLYMD